VLKVAVVLPAMIGEVGDYLANVTALEAAGAEAIWVDDTAVEPWVMLGALAALTHRVGLGCMLTSMDRWPAAQLGGAAAALQTLSRGRLAVGLPPDGVLEDQLAALRATGVRIFSSQAGAADRLSVATGASAETWAVIAAPSDREDWNATIGANDSAGIAGVIVPWSDRLIDLLRNPEPDDRSDLLVSTG